MLDPGFGTLHLAYKAAADRRNKLLKGIKGRIRRGTDRYGTDELSNAGIDFETSKRSNPYSQIEFLEGTPQGKQQLILNAAKAKKDNKNKNEPYRSQHEQHIIY